MWIWKLPKSARTANVFRFAWLSLFSCLFCCSSASAEQPHTLHFLDFGSTNVACICVKRWLCICGWFSVRRKTAVSLVSRQMPLPSSMFENFVVIRDWSGQIFCVCLQIVSKSHSQRQRLTRSPEKTKTRNQRISWSSVARTRTVVLLLLLRLLLCAFFFFFATDSGRISRMGVIFLLFRFGVSKLCVCADDKSSGETDYVCKSVMLVGCCCCHCQYTWRLYVCISVCKGPSAFVLYCAHVVRIQWNKQPRADDVAGMRNNQPTPHLTVTHLTKNWMAVAL